MFQEFPYTNFHQLNLDWIVKIAKDFLDQYTHIQEVIQTGLDDLAESRETGLAELDQKRLDSLAELNQKTLDGLADLQEKYDTLYGLLQAWYDTHSADIANQLAAAITAFNTAAETKSQALLDSWPDDYSELVTEYDVLTNALLSELTDTTAPGWESGWFEYSDGSNKASSSYIRNQTTFGLSNGVVKISCENGYKFMLFAWDKNGTYVGSLKSGNIFDTTSSNVTTVTEFSCGTYPEYTFKIAMRREPASTDITPAEYNKCHLSMVTDKTLTKENKAADAKAVGELKNKIGDNEIDITGELTYGFINKSTGAFTDTPSSTSFRRSDYIPITSGFKYYFTGYVTNDFCGVAGYDNNKENYQAIIAPSSGTQYTKQLLTIPNNVSYIAVCSQSSNPHLYQELIVSPIIEENVLDIRKLKEIVGDGELTGGDTLTGAVNDLDTEVGETEANIAVDIVNGYIGKTTGNLISIDTATFKRSGYILVSPNCEYRFTGYVANNICGVAGYDANKGNYQAIIAPDNATNYTDQLLTIPNGVVYIAVSAQSSAPLLKEKLVISPYIRNNKKMIGELDSLVGHDELSTTAKTIVGAINELNNPPMQPLELVTVSVFERIGICGDSYSSGGIYGVSGVTDGMYRNVSWCAIFGRRNGVECPTFATAGATAKSWLTGTDCLPKLVTTDKCNMYIVFLGINDASGPVGTIADVNDEDPSQNADTFYGNYAKVYHAIHDYAPTAKLIFAIPPMTTGLQWNCIQTLAERYGVPWFRIDTDPLFSTDFYIDNRSSGHPVAMTYGSMALAFERKLAECIVNNMAYFKDYTGVIPS